MNRLAFGEDLESGRAMSAANVLAVGDTLSPGLHAAVDPDGDSTTFASYSDVTPSLVDTLGPEVVVSLVLGSSFDCVDLAEKLSAMGFDGRYCLIAHGLPRPDLILREIRSLFPMLKVELEDLAH